MAVSGNQLTRIGGSLSGVGRKVTILAKAPSVITTTILNFSRGFARAFQRGLFR